MHLVVDKIRKLYNKPWRQERPRTAVLIDVFESRGVLGGVTSVLSSGATKSTPTGLPSCATKCRMRSDHEQVYLAACLPDVYSRKSPPS